MSELYLHERLYRGEEAIAKLGAVKFTLRGAGALGSLLADNGAAGSAAVDSD